MDMPFLRAIGATFLFAALAQSTDFEVASIRAAQGGGGPAGGMGMLRSAPRRGTTLSPRRPVLRLRSCSARCCNSFSQNGLSSFRTVRLEK
jgi:hypothetical protein